MQARRITVCRLSRVWEGKEKGRSHRNDSWKKTWLVLTRLESYWLLPDLCLDGGVIWNICVGHTWSNWDFNVLQKTFKDVFTLLKNSGSFLMNWIISFHLEISEETGISLAFIHRGVFLLNYSWLKSAPTLFVILKCLVKKWISGPSSSNVTIISMSTSKARVFCLRSLPEASKSSPSSSRYKTITNQDIREVNEVPMANSTCHN